MHNPIDVLCPEARCNCAAWYNFDEKRTVFQHGDNPEALFFITDEERFSNTAQLLRKKYYRWVEQVHKHLDGENNA